MPCHNEWGLPRFHRVKNECHLGCMSAWVCLLWGGGEGLKCWSNLVSRLFSFHIQQSLILRDFELSKHIRGKKRHFSWPRPLYFQVAKCCSFALAYLHVHIGWMSCANFQQCRSIRSHLHARWCCFTTKSTSFNIWCSTIGSKPPKCTTLVTA